jgi:hypothetical protein
MGQITLQNTIDELITFSTGHTQVSSTSFGEMDKLSSASISYPHIRINYRTSEVKDKRVYRNFQIVCADIKTQTNDILIDDSLIAKYSLTESILHELLTYLADSPQFRNVYRLEPTFRIYAAATKFLDGSVATVMDLTISVLNELCIGDVQIDGGGS